MVNDSFTNRINPDDFGMAMFTDLAQDTELWPMSKPAADTSFSHPVLVEQQRKPAGIAKRQTLKRPPVLYRQAGADGGVLIGPDPV